MNQKLPTQNIALRLLTPLCLFTLLVFLASSSLFSESPESLSKAITIDLLITVPFIYFLLIRKTKIPKTTIVPLILLGVLVGSFIIPSENQQYLSLFKTWAIPFIEIGVVSFVLYHLHKAIKSYKRKKEHHKDFFILLKSACSEILPKPFINPVVTEIAVFYYGFIYWKPRVLSKNEFSYHKKSGTIPLLAAIILIVAVETVVFHKLLSGWSTIAAWIFTILSIYSGLQLFGFLKSMLKRPSIIGNKALYLRYGIMGESTVGYNEIESIEITTREIEFDKETRKLSFLGDLEAHNMIINFTTKQQLTGLYGIKRTYKTLALHIDEKEDFKRKIEERIEKHRTHE